jgi:hypothetical protein
MVEGTDRARSTPVQDEDEGYLYNTRLLLPLIAGLCVLGAGLLLISAGWSRPSSLVDLLEIGVALVVIGLVLFFAIGLWLIPGSVLLGGVAFLAAFEVDAHLSGASRGAGIALAVLGGVSLLQALRASLRWLELRPPPDA